jgi:putative transposase
MEVDNEKKEEIENQARTELEPYLAVLRKEMQAAGSPKEFIKKCGGTDAVIKTMMKPFLEAMLECEMEHHLGYEKHAPGEKPGPNRRNGRGCKTVRGDFGEVEIATPRDREGTFEPAIVGKRQSSVGSFTDKVISLYTRGMTTREIEEHLRDMYGIDVSPQFISRATERLQEELAEWQSRPLEPFYPIVYVDGLMVSARSGENKGPVTKKCVYVVLGVSAEGRQEVLGLWLQESEGARFWLKVFNDLKARGVRDIFILCGDGLTGLPDAAQSVFPEVDVQLCVVHHIRNVTRFVSYQNRKDFCRDMKPIYTAPTVEAAEQALLELEKRWGARYPASIDSWKRHWEQLTAFFKYPVECRRIIYTTNAIESLNAQLRKNTSNRKAFPTENSILTLFFLNVRNFSRRWTKRQGWDTVMNQFSLMFADRIVRAVEDQQSR